MSAQVASSVGSDAKELFKDTGKSFATVLAATGGNPVPLFAVFLGALVAAAGAFFVWLDCSCARPRSTSRCCSYRSPSWR